MKQRHALVVVQPPISNKSRKVRVVSCDWGLIATFLVDGIHQKTNAVVAVWGVRRHVSNVKRCWGASRGNTGTALLKANWSGGEGPELET